MGEAWRHLRGSRGTVDRRAVPWLFDRIGWALGAMQLVDGRAYERLVALGAFGDCRSVLEVGGGNGRLAERLLAGELVTDARYLVTEMSPVLCERVRRRLERFGERAGVALVDPEDPYRFGGAPDAGFDRVIGTYVHDMMPSGALGAHLDRAHGLLSEGGLLCLLVTARGRDALSRAVMGAWGALYAVHPAIVGGSRPVDVAAHLGAGRWCDVRVEWVCSWGFASEVVIARKATAA